MLAAENGLPAPQSLSQAQAMMSGLLAQLAGALTAGSLTDELPTAASPSTSSVHQPAGPYLSTFYAAGNHGYEYPATFRSLVLSHPSHSDGAQANLAGEQLMDGQDAVLAASEAQDLAREGTLPFPEPRLVLAVDAPGGPPVAWGSWAQSGAGLDGESLPADEVLAGPRPTMISAMRPAGARPGEPLPADLQVNVRVIAALAAGLVLPNVLLIGSGVARRRALAAHADLATQPQLPK